MGFATTTRVVVPMVNEARDTTTVVRNRGFRRKKATGGLSRVNDGYNPMTDTRSLSVENSTVGERTRTSWSYPRGEELEENGLSIGQFIVVIRSELNHVVRLGASDVEKGKGGGKSHGGRRSSLAAG